MFSQGLALPGPIAAPRLSETRWIADDALAPSRVALPRIRAAV
jgi:hypothetical protein